MTSELIFGNDFLKEAELIVRDGKVMIQKKCITENDPAGAIEDCYKLMTVNFIQEDKIQIIENVEMKKKSY